MNIPEDVQRVGPDPAEGEQMAVLAAGVGKIYGSKDEANGRVNPALEPDYDMEPGFGDSEPPGGGGGFQGAFPGPQPPFHQQRQPQSSTAF